MASIAGLLAATAVAATATAAPVPATTSNWDLVIPQGGFDRKFLNDCLISRHEAFQEFTTSSSPASHVFEGVGVPISGSFDPAARTGSVTSNVPAFRIDNFNAHARAIVVGWLSLKASGKGAVISGRIQRTRTIFARVGPRRPLLRIKRLTIESGPFQRKGKDVPDTFVIGLYGRATVLPAFARELTRIRCRGPHIVTSHPIRFPSRHRSHAQTISKPKSSIGTCENSRIESMRNQLSDVMRIAAINPATLSTSCVMMR